MGFSTLLAIIPHPLFCRYRRCRCSRTDTDNLQNRIAILSAVVMNFVAIMSDETARRDRLQIIRVVIAAGADPPRAGNHGNESVIRMRMRLAVVMRLPFVQHHIKPRLGRVADQYCGFRAAGIGDPFDVIGQLDRNSLGIKIGRRYGTEAQGQAGCQR